jgi:DNA-3-methyladenine glycosylase
MKVESKRDFAKLASVPRDFFGRDVVTVSRDILGKVLVRREARRIRAARIVEVEAYLGISDPAAHAAAGKTARNFVLFGPPGHAYIYFIYGNHYCLNISCEPEGKAGSVLIRALEPLTGMELMAEARGIEGDLERLSLRRSLTSGPGRLAEAFDITRERDNDKDVTAAKSDLRIVDDGFRPEKIAVTPRIGITKAAQEELRFVVAGNAFVSGKKL